MKSLSIRTTTNSMSNVYAEDIVNVLKSGVTASPYWSMKAYGIAIYTPQGNLIKTLTPVTLSTTTSGNQYYIVITAEDTSTDAYTTDRAHLIGVTPGGAYWSIFKAIASSSVSKGTSDTLKVTFQIGALISDLTYPGIMVEGFNFLYTNLNGQDTRNYAPVNSIRIRLTNGVLQDFTASTVNTTSGTEDSTPYYGIKVTYVDTSADAKDVNAIFIGRSPYWMSVYGGGSWSKPANTTVTWYHEWRFKYGYTVTTSGIPSTY